MTLIDRVKEHWLGGVILVGAVSVATTWFIANEVLVKPRDFTIQQRDDVIDEQRAAIEKKNAIIANLELEVRDLKRSMPDGEAVKGSGRGSSPPDQRRGECRPIRLAATAFDTALGTRLEWKA